MSKVAVVHAFAVVVVSFKIGKIDVLNEISEHYALQNLFFFVLQSIKSLFYIVQL